MYLIRVKQIEFSSIRVLTVLNMLVNCLMSFEMQWTVLSPVFLANEFFRKDASHVESFSTTLWVSVSLFSLICLHPWACAPVLFAFTQIPFWNPSFFLLYYPVFPSCLSKSVYPRLLLGSLESFIYRSREPYFPARDTPLLVLLSSPSLSVAHPPSGSAMLSDPSSLHLSLFSSFSLS
jgi:hypothetical protein